MLQQVRASREHVQGQGTRMAKGRGHFAAEAHQGRGVGQNIQSAPKSRKRRIIPQQRQLGEKKRYKGNGICTCTAMESS